MTFPQPVYSSLILRSPCSELAILMDYTELAHLQTVHIFQGTTYTDVHTAHRHSLYKHLYPLVLEGMGRRWRGPGT